MSAAPSLATCWLRYWKQLGYTVTREYYINDAGAQVDILARSAHLRYLEALGEDIGPIPEGLYPGDYLKSVGQGLASEMGRAGAGSRNRNGLAPFGTSPSPKCWP